MVITILDKANCPSSSANHTAGFSGQNGGIRIPTRLIAVQWGGCSGRVDVAASSCTMRVAITSGSPMWWLCGT